MVLALSMLLVSMPAGGARSRYRTVSVDIAPGVTFTKIRDPKGPWAIGVVSVLLSEASTIEPVLATGKLPGYETTSSMASRYGAIAAINGDYARASGRPVMLFAQDGELAQTALTFGVNFAVNESETAAYIQHQSPEMWLQEADTGLDTSVTQFNAGPPTSGSVSGFSALGGRDERPPSSACSARLYPTEPFHDSATRVGLEQTHVVNQVECKNGTLWPKRGRVFSTPMDGATTPGFSSSFQPGDEVRFGWSLGWPDVFDTIGGNPTLVRDGEVFIGKGETPFFKWHPRTGVGITGDGRVLFVTVDGRDRNRSVGMSPLQFARLFVSLGAQYALNLDGGGSTTMLVNGKIVNRPSDGSERPVSSALLLLPGPDPTPVASPAPMPAASPSPSPSPSLLPPVKPHFSSQEVWLRMANDPASTGGLAQWLMHEGIRIGPGLTKAAKIFRRR